MLALLLCPRFVHAQGAQPTKGASAAKGRDITGTVADIDGSPVAGATVAIAGGGPTATTAADGSFQLTGVATTHVMIEITADGFTAKQVAVLGAATPLQLQVVIVKPAPAAPPPPETRVVGGVVSDAGHAPIAGATVTVHGTSIRAVTGADGSFALPGVPLGEITLDVTAPGQPPASVPVPGDRPVVTIAMGASAQPAAPTTRTIQGRVIDPATGEPIAGATVQVGSTGATVFTGADGTFVLESVPLGPVKLEVSAPEHESHLLEVAPERSTVDVPLALAQGEQIVIEGRAPVIVKENLRNGASVIDGKDLTRVSAATLDDALTGKLAGANLQFNSGAPGGGAQLRLRGISTINGQSSPLYVIDGVIISNVALPTGINAITAAASGGNSSNQDNPANRLADLNPNDIESVEVLKGASAAALYGSKASNGVVLITTRRGRKDENHASVIQRIGVAQVSHTLGARRFSSVEDVKAVFCSSDQTTDECNASPMVQAFLASRGKVFDHEAEIEQTPIAFETLGSVSGGSESGDYYGSTLIADDPGVVKGTFYHKQTGRVAVGYRFGNRVRLGVTANLIHSLTDRGLTNNDNAGVSNYGVLAVTPSFLDLRPRNGVYPANPAIGSGTNPLQTVALFQNREDVWRIIGGATVQVDAFASQDGTSKVKLLGNFGADSFDQKNSILSPNALIFEPKDGLPGTSVSAASSNLNWNTGASAVWSYRPLDNQFRSALSGGWTYESVDLDSVYVIGQNLSASQQNVDSGAAINTSENRLRTRDAGLYAQEEIAVLDEQLSVLGGLLTERSSLNGDTSKYFLYPKIAAVYSLIGAKDKTSPLARQFDSLRVRGAFGEAGNRPNYGQKFTPLNATTNIDGNAGLVFGTRGQAGSPPQPGSLGDAQIKPERQREIEIGVDAATKDERIVAEITGYQRNISNLLLQRALATSTGFATEFLNGGGLRNRGLEAALQVRPLGTRSVEWISRATFTLNRSEISDLPVPAFDITSAGFGEAFGAYRIENGKSATQIVATVRGALQVVGNGEPDFRVGWLNVVTAGDVTFGALLDWQQGSKVIDGTQLIYDSAFNGASNAPDTAAAARRYAAVVRGDPRAYIEDGTFVKLRELSVTYALPRRLISQLAPLRTLQVGLSGRNLLTLTHYQGLDPEVSNFSNQSIGRNYDIAPYPPSRSYWLSVTAGI